MTGFYFWNWLEKVKEKKLKNDQEKTKKGRMRHPPTTFLNQTQGEGNIFKSEWKGPLSVCVCVSMSLSSSSMQAPVLAALENVRPWTGRGWGVVDEGCGGRVRQGRKNNVFWGFRTPYLSYISNHFEKVQSQFMKQSTSTDRLHSSPFSLFKLIVLFQPLLPATSLFSSSRRLSFNEKLLINLLYTAWQLPSGAVDMALLLGAWGEHFGPKEQLIQEVDLHQK